MRSVFDVSADIMSLLEQDVIDAVKLQKLVYYAFGWYGGLTGESLFDQQFYPMPHGPVTGSLLSAHAGQPQVTREQIERAREAFGDTYVEKDPYYVSLLEAVLGYYGPIDTWRLRDMTHEDTVWRDAWESRESGSRRAAMSHDSIIEYFSTRRDIPESLRCELPPPRRIVLSEEEWNELRTLPDEPSQDMIDVFAASLP